MLKCKLYSLHSDKDYLAKQHCGFQLKCILSNHMGFFLISLLKLEPANNNGVKFYNSGEYIVKYFGFQRFEKSPFLFLSNSHFCHVKAAHTPSTIVPLARTYSYGHMYCKGRQGNVVSSWEAKTSAKTQEIL